MAISPPRVPALFVGASLVRRQGLIHEGIATVQDRFATVCVVGSRRSCHVSAGANVRKLIVIASVIRIMLAYAVALPILFMLDVYVAYWRQTKGFSS